MSAVVRTPSCYVDARLRCVLPAHEDGGGIGFDVDAAPLLVMVKGQPTLRLKLSRKDLQDLSTALQSALLDPPFADIVAPDYARIQRRAQPTRRSLFVFFAACAAIALAVTGWGLFFAITLGAPR